MKVNGGKQISQKMKENETWKSERGREELSLMHEPKCSS
jgi:hypothetical protein